MREPLITVFALLILAGCVSSERGTGWLDGERDLLPAVEVAGEAEKPTLAARMQRYGVPAVSIALIENDAITSLEALGVIEAGTAKAPTLATQFQAASISKPVTALGIMALVDDGTLDLDAPANSYLSDWQIPSTRYNAEDPVTIRELLSHSGGISVPSYPGFERGAEKPSSLDILRGAPNAYSDAVTLAHQQGEYHYSGGAYMILQRVIEEQSGQDFERFMQEKVFRPADMTSSTFAIREDESGAAFGHDWTGARRADPWQDYPQAAAAGLWTTPEDLARLMIAYGRAFKGSPSGLLSHDAATAMAMQIAGDAGLGFGVEGEGDTLRLTHSGWTIGYRSRLIYFPERGAGIIVMTNADAGHYLIDDIVRTYASERAWPGYETADVVVPARISDEARAVIVGQYTMSPGGFSIDITENGDRFILQTPRGSRYSLVAIGAKRFVIEETGDRVELDPNGNLKVWDMSGEKVLDPNAGPR